MHCHLLIPALFPPSALTRENDPLHGVAAPALQALLARGNCMLTPASDMESWLCETFGVARQQDYPSAAFSALGDGLDAGSGCWLHADPVHLGVERDQLILTEASAFPLAREEADALIVTLNQHFAPDGLNFVASLPQRWYLRLEHAPALTTHGLYQAAGNNIHALLPAGPDAMRWRALLNEVQMLLFEHPVNVAREARGIAPVNSIWPWGAGILPQSSPHCSFEGVWGNDPLVRGLARAGSIADDRLPENAATWLKHLHPGNHLAVLDSLLPLACYGDAHAWRDQLAWLEQHWFAPLKQAVQGGHITLTLHAPTPAGTLACTASRSGLWKLWRPARSLIHYRPLSQ